MELEYISISSLCSCDRRAIIHDHQWCPRLLAILVFQATRKREQALETEAELDEIVQDIRYLYHPPDLQPQDSNEVMQQEQPVLNFADLPKADPYTYQVSALEQFRRDKTPYNCRWHERWFRICQVVAQTEGYYMRFFEHNLPKKTWRRG